MLAENQRLTGEDRIRLVAYLDGELPAAEAEALGLKLTQSLSARREVEALERTWELLDYLPRPTASTELTARTVTLVRDLEAKGGRAAVAAGRAARRVGQVAACLAVAALTLGVGYAATRWLWPDPTARLARDLSLAEHLEEYEDVGSFEFLRQLDESPLLDEVPPPGPGR